MAPPANIVQWIHQAYPRPKVDPEWLEGCCDWIAQDKQLDPVQNREQFIREVEGQLLSSDLQDSMLPGTGLPGNILHSKKTNSGPQSILVELRSITEIGASAFTLLNTRQARNEREDLAGLVQREREQQGNEGAEEEEGPIPRYPRQMLKMDISDGTVNVPAVEYRKLPELQLGETPLGFKILLKNVLIRNGIVFLEPKTVVLKGHSCHERDANRDFEFVRSLHRRLGRPDPPQPDGDQEENANNDVEPPPAAPMPPPRVPFDDIREPDATMVDNYDAGLPHGRRRLPDTPPPSTNASAPAPSLPLSGATLVDSPYFNRTGPNAPPLTSTNPRSPTRTLGRLFSSVGTARHIPMVEPIDLADSSSDSMILPLSSRIVTSASTSSGGHASSSSSSAPPAPQQERDEFDLSSDFDVTILDEVDRMEQAAIGGSQQRVEVHPPPPTQRPRPVSVQPEIITIDDDDDDKENIPVPTRRVRRRVDPGVRRTDPDVIELSD